MIGEKFDDVWVLRAGRFFQWRRDDPAGGFGNETDDSRRRFDIRELSEADRRGRRALI